MPENGTHSTKLKPLVRCLCNAARILNRYQCTRHVTVNEFVGMDGHLSLDVGMARRVLVVPSLFARNTESGFAVDALRGRITRVSTYAVVAVVLSLAVMIVDRELSWAYPTSAVIGWIAMGLRAVNTVLVPVLWRLLWAYHDGRHRLAGTSRVFLVDLDGMWPLRRRFQYGLEALVVCFHDPPFIELGSLTTLGGVPNPWVLLMFLRVYVIARHAWMHGTRCMNLERHNTTRGRGEYTQNKKSDSGVSSCPSLSHLIDCLALGFSNDAILVVRCHFPCMWHQHWRTTHGNGCTGRPVLSPLRPVCGNTLWTIFLSVAFLLRLASCGSSRPGVCVYVNALC